MKDGSFVVAGALYEGLALAVTIGMAKRGHSVIILAREPSERPEKDFAAMQDRVKTAFQDRHWPLYIIRYRPGDPISITDAIGQIKAICPPVGYWLIGDGCRAYPYTEFVESSVADWVTAIDLTLVGSMLILQGYLAEMRARNFGRIVNISFNEKYWINHLYARGGNYLTYNNWPFFVLNKTRADYIQNLAYSEYRFNVKANTIEPGRVQRVSLETLLVEGAQPNSHVVTNSITLAETVVKQLLCDDCAITGATVPMLNEVYNYRLLSEEPCGK